MSFTDHLKVTATERGFALMPPIPSTRGGDVRAYESSAADGPHIWLKITVVDGEWTAAKLTTENAEKLAEQLITLCRNHYQGKAE